MGTLLYELEVARDGQAQAARPRQHRTGRTVGVGRGLPAAHGIRDCDQQTLHRDGLHVCRGSGGHRVARRPRQTGTERCIQRGLPDQEADGRSVLPDRRPGHAARRRCRSWQRPRGAAERSPRPCCWRAQHHPRPGQRVRRDGQTR